MLCVAWEESRCKTSHEDLPSEQTLRLYSPKNEHMWPLGFKKGTPECPKNPQIPNILTDSCSVKDKITVTNCNPQTILVQTRARWVVCGCIVDTNKVFILLCCAHDIDIATVNVSTVQEYRDRLRVWADILISCFHFFVVFNDIKNSFSVFISFRSLYAAFTIP